MVRDDHQVHMEEFSFGPGTTVELRKDDPAGPWQLRVFRSVVGRHTQSGEQTIEPQSDQQCVLDVWATVGRYQRVFTTPMSEETP